MLRCWWFQWGAYRLLEYFGAFEIQEGGAEVAVCGDWCLGLRQALVRWFRRFGAAPVSSAASSEFSLVSLLSAGGRALWWGHFMEASAWASQYYRLVTHVLTGAVLWSFLILRFACSWRPSQDLSSVLSSAFRFRFSIMFFITVFCCCVSSFISVFVFSATSISLYRLSQTQKIGNAILTCLPKKKKFKIHTNTIKMFNIYYKYVIINTLMVGHI